MFLCLASLGPAVGECLRSPVSLLRVLGPGKVRSLHIGIVMVLKYEECVTILYEVAKKAIGRVADQERDAVFFAEPFRTKEQSEEKKKNTEKVGERVDC